MKYNIHTIAKFFACAAVTLFTAACSDDAIEERSLIEFGTTGEKTYTVNATAGYVDLKLLSNQKCNIHFAEECDWAVISTDKIQGDGQYVVYYDDNEGFPRMAKIVVDAPAVGLSDTITLRQRGLYAPEVKLANGTMILGGSVAGSGSEVLTTNLDFDKEVKPEVVYTGGEGTDWVKAVTCVDGKLNIEYAANPSQTPRSARLDLIFDNGWGDMETTSIFLTQKNSKDELGSVVSFETIRSKARMSAEVKLNDYYIISGYVVSNKESRNAGENPNTSPTAIDYSICDRTVYLESEDGKYGFNIVMDKAEDNVFNRYDKIQLLLKDAMIYAENDPDRYTISRVNTTNIVGRVAGTKANIPVKEKYIDELTDADMYTYVTLKDVQVGVRKGGLTPVHDGYTSATGAHRLSKYPKVFIDTKGSSIYVYTNTTCPYRRDGRKLPYGTGNLSGVVVFEYFKSYVYGDGYDEDTHGRIGTYQIRHQSYDDIQMSDTESKIEVLTEYCYVKNRTVDADKQRSYWYPTWGNNGRMCSTSPRYLNGCFGVTNWNYLGWTGDTKGVEPFKNHVGDDKVSGTGIILEDGTNYKATDGNHNTYGKGQRLNSLGDAWAMDYWFEKNADGSYTPNSWIVEVSTAGLTTEALSMIISVQGAYAGEYMSPIYWTARWSTEEDLTDDSKWNKIGDYQVPDFPIWANYHEWSLAAYKQIAFPLPKEILGKDKVYIRLNPSSLRSNSTFAFDAGECITPDTKCRSAIEYFSIRYTK